jgi:hypothetical protein
VDTARGRFVIISITVIVGVLGIIAYEKWQGGYSDVAGSTTLTQESSRRDEVTILRWEKEEDYLVRMVTDDLLAEQQRS